ncbi:MULTISPECIES: GIN domain-containing protein [Deefgea]|uniref:Putative auto-transporter adhesin head GIN domain-containing protein n=1 Tax=Deefgea chitinilytica TaxID=570276 RepID=A0ABS2CBU5_9NEIS|nr:MULTISPECIES: DUF2807 domain-containing protein [Deefgea]MBM5571618.1 hypothetical protein [Deefgea chitinilytica]MBM9888853.1 DUF2807 domain-containing protein [Deefgea sp. CFH1-16]
MNNMKQLKKWLFPACVLAVLALGTVTVWQAKPNPHFVINNGSAAFEFALQSKGAIQPSGKVVQVLLSNQGAKLINRSPVNVRQFSAPKASIELDEALLAELDQDLLAQGIIELRNGQNISPNMPAIVFNSALVADQSVLSEVENDGSGITKIQSPNLKQIRVSNRGAGRVEILTNKVQTAIVSNVGVGEVYLPNVGQIQIDSRGTGNVYVEDADTATVQLYGVGTVTFANEPKMNANIKGMGKIKTMTPHPYE